MICIKCKDQHNADSKHFPVVLRNKKDNRVLGYICSKCVKKEVKRENREKRPI
jgi:hypothetical protein